MPALPVPLSLPTEGPAPAVRPLAGFIAQMIACDAGLGAGRIRRRAPAGQASALYRAGEEAARARPLAERRV